MSTNRARLSWRVRLPFLQRRWLPVRPGMQVMKKAGWCPCECKSLLHKIHIKLHYIICMRVFIYIYVYMYVYTCIYIYKFPKKKTWYNMSFDLLTNRKHSSASPTPGLCLDHSLENVIKHISSFGAFKHQKGV